MISRGFFTGDLFVEGAAHGVVLRSLHAHAIIRFIDAVAAPPVIIHVILDTLAPLGVTIINMPATPERIWRAIQEAQ